MHARRAAFAALALFVFAVPAFAASPTVVISQVYGGAGCTTLNCSTYKNDYIELFNRSTTTPQSLSGWSVQYASATGTSWQVTALPNVTLQPGQYFLISENGNPSTNGVNPLPSPDVTNGAIQMSATGAKVALVSSITALAGACPVGGSIVDFVGYGTTPNCFEDGGPAPAPSTTTSIFRGNGGCVDTDSNSSDFATGVPTPRNTSTALHSCVNAAPTINNPANPAATVQTNSAPFNVSVTGSDDQGVYNWSATPGTGIAAVSVGSGQGTATVTYSVSLQTNFAGTASFTASLSDNVNSPATTKTINIQVNAINNPPTIAVPANPITTVEANAPAFTVSLDGTDDGGVYNWSASAGTGVALLSVSGGQGTSHATFSVTIQGGFSGTATFTASLSDNVNAAATQVVNITVTPPPPPPNHVVISQIYGGGGNTSATYTNDYVELYNPTASTVDMTGWTIQYQAAASTGTWSGFQPIGGTIGPGEYFLVQLASGGAVGAPLPAANIVGGPSTINMSATAGKIALVSNGDSLINCAFNADPDLVDLVGYGTTANCREGSTNAPAGSNTTALFRKNGGLTDTDVNGADFITGAPNPRRTSPIQEIGPVVTTVDPVNGSTIAPHDASMTLNFSEPVFVDPNWFDITCASTGSHNDVTTASNDGGATWVITPNVSFAAGETCTVTIFKDKVHDVDTDDSNPNTDTLPANKAWSFTVSTGDPAPYPASVHLTMGNPSNAIDDVNVPNNYLMEKPTYALSYNRDKGTPNWVSWHLTNEWYGTLSRNDTFRPDPLVSANWYRVQAFDFSFSGFDRGHMCPNADRDNQNRIPINQETYLMSNMVPQAPDNNQGPWANLENYLRTLTDAGSEIYIVSGPAGVGGTGSNGGVTTTLANGHVTVPAYTWKVALVLPKLDGDDVARVTAATRTIAVIMPNVQGIRTNNSSDWMTYLTSVHAVEQLTGYNFYSNVPQIVQNAFEYGVNGDNPPGTADQSVSTNEDNAKTFTLAVANPTANVVTYHILTNPQHGTLSGSNGSETYTPAPDFNGTDTFTFNVTDGTHTSNTSTVTISVLEVNDAPTATADAEATAEDTPVTFAASDLTANDSAGPANESSQTLTVTAVSATINTHGTVSLSAGQITYSPETNYNGSASFNYHVCDNGVTAGLADAQCADGTVNLTITPVNDDPVANADSPSTNEDTPVTINVLSNDTDVDGDALTITASSAGAIGTTAIVNNQIVYTPNANRNGTDSFTYTISDGHGGSATGNVNVTVIAVNDPPTFVAVATDSEITDHDTFRFTFAADDIEHDALTFSIDGDAHGATIDSHTGAFLFSPAPAQALSTFAFTVVVDDGNGGQARTSFTIHVKDATPPSITGFSTSLTQLWPANHQMIDVSVLYTPSDIADPNPPACSLSVISNEPDNGLGDGDTPGDIQVIDSHHVKLRSERSGLGSGRIYTITATCTDASGNHSSQSAIVTVPKSQK